MVHTWTAYIHPQVNITEKYFTNLAESIFVNMASNLYYDCKDIITYFAHPSGCNSEEDYFWLK